MKREQIERLRGPLLNMSLTACGVRHELRWQQTEVCPERVRENNLFCVHTQSRLMHGIIRELVDADVLSFSGRDILSNTLYARPQLRLDTEVILVTEISTAFERKEKRTSLDLPAPYRVPKEKLTRNFIVRTIRRRQRELAEPTVRVRKTLLWILRQLERRPITSKEIDHFLGATFGRAKAA